MERTLKRRYMYVLIIVNLISGGFTTTTLHDFSNQAKCEAAKANIMNLNRALGTKPGVFQISCLPQ